MNNTVCTKCFVGFIGEAHDLFYANGIELVVRATQSGFFYKLFGKKSVASFSKKNGVG